MLKTQDDDDTYTMLSIRAEIWENLGPTHHVGLAVSLRSSEYSFISFDRTGSSGSQRPSADSFPIGLPAEEAVYSVAPIRPNEELGPCASKMNGSVPPPRVGRVVAFGTVEIRAEEQVVS